MLEKDIVQLSQEYYEEMKKLRHHFHMFPELGFNEFNTSKTVEDELIKLNLDNVQKLAKTGVSAVIKGKYPGKTILLRADMDALPVNEEADIEYKSKNKGVMHACGHDGHTAALLGTAMILNNLKDKLHGNVKLVFQPAEEGDGGARLMIEEGVLDNPKVDAAIACHLWGNIPEGHVVIKNGPLMASCDDFMFKIVGKGGHGSTPELCIDPIDICINAMNTIRNFVSRRISALDPVVLSFGAINGGNSFNCIPDEVTVLGTLRTFNNDTRDFVINSMENILKFMTESQGAKYSIEINRFAPTVVNDENMTKIAIKSFEKVIGENKIIEAKQPYTGSEDFAFFTSEVPSVFFFTGIMKDKEVIHHNSHFQWDDINLLTSCRCLCQIAVDFLNDDNK
ncbi:M20 metallopeptidase family protein [Clostridium lundense]|uniref:M20 metallopeptidase family protein n=1 Tax=Clostridium lundense TaxID=319475 RepID=UPI00068625B6|nr:M20 family metallopeptidase [Clostridium lundense]